MTIRQVSWWYWVVDRLPKRLIYFCFMKVMAHATTGRYGHFEVPSVTGMDAIRRYARDHGMDAID